MDHSILRLAACIAASWLVWPVAAEEIVRGELIYHGASATTPEVLSVADIRRLIAEAGREAIERDTLYHRVVRHGAKWETAEALATG